MEDILIIGAGTAGMTAAIYGARAAKSVLMFEGKTYGGQIVPSPEVENYPAIKKTSGSEFAINLYEQATELGAKMKSEEVTSIKVDGKNLSVVTSKETYNGKTIIIATGAKNRPLGLAREEELIGKGISYCATCDGAFFKGKTVAVVGGGNTALEDSSFLTGYCEKVYLIHRRDSFRGEEKLVERLKSKPNLEFILDTTVTELIGEPNLQEIEISNVKTNTKSKLKVSGLFVAIGQVPQNGMFSPPVNLDEKGYIIAGEDCKTNVEGVFTAGDCRTKAVRQLSTAAGDGTVAALNACEFITMNYD